MKNLKDKKITIIEIHEEYVPGKGSVVTRAPLPGGENIWAYYRQMSGKEFIAGQAVAIRVDAVFDINWRDDLDTTMIIQYNGEEYDIQWIDAYEGYKNDLRIHASIRRGT